MNWSCAKSAIFARVTAASVMDVAFPTLVIGPVRLAFVDVDPELPVTDPEIGAVTVREPSVPTDVSEDAVTPEASVDPVRVPAAAGIADPSSSSAPPNIDSLLVWFEIENDPFE